MARTTKQEKRRKAKNKRNKDKLMANLKTVAPGVAVNENYKPGVNPALDAVIKKLKKDPSSLDRSGMGQHWGV